MRRRDFITLIGGAAAAWPLAAQAQQARRVGILMPYPENEPDIQARVRAFKQELQRLGWAEGSKIEFDERWATDNMESVRSNAASLLEGKPDAVVAIGGRVIPMLKQMTRSIPIVVAGTGDPLGTGIVTSLAHPGENITGFSLLELSIIGKFLELLKQMAPNVSRVTLIFNPDNASTRFFKQEFDSAAPALGVDPMVAPIHGLVDVERAIEERATSPNGGLLFAPDVTVTALRRRILAPRGSLASRITQSLRVLLRWRASEVGFKHQIFGAGEQVPHGGRNDTRNDAHAGRWTSRGVIPLIRKSSL